MATTQNFLLLTLLPLVLFSCGNEENPDTTWQLAKEKFELSWQSDSADKVLKYRTEIATIAPKSEYGLYSKSWLKARKGEKALALKIADSLVMGFPTFDKGLYLRANLKNELNDPDGALKDFDRCLKKNPTFFEAYMNRGSLYFKTDHPELALRDFEKAIALKPMDKMVLLNLGKAKIALGKSLEACKFWEMADSLGAEEAAILLANFCSTGKP